MNHSSVESIQEDEGSHPLSAFCGKQFWNVSSSWEADFPDMGLCMERTVLVWIPCLLLWLLSPLQIILLRRKGICYMPWTAVSITKMTASLLLIATAMTELVWALLLFKKEGSLPANEFLAPVVLLISYILHVVLVQLGRRHGERISGFIYGFWFLMVLCGIPQVITTVSYTVLQDDRLHLLMAITFLLQYSGAVILFTINCFTDRPPDSEYLIKSQKAMPDRNASFVSKMTFHWVNGMLRQGYSRTLTRDDVWDLPSQLSSPSLDKKWDIAWQKELSVIRKKNPGNDPYNLPKVSVLKVLLRMYFWADFLALLVFYITEIMSFASPKLLSALISFTTDESEPAWHGYFYATLLLFISMLNMFVRHIYFFTNQKIATQVKSSIMSAVYRKALVLSNTSRREFSLGEIVNLMAIDSQRMFDALLYLPIATSAPLVIPIALYELWMLLGPSALSGLAVLMLLIPLNSLVANKIKTQQAAQMELKDKRIKLLTEIINGIKVLKLYAWEGPFAQQVNDIRSNEVKCLRRSAYFQALSNFMFLTTPYLVALASFATFLMVSKENVLDAKTAFVAISLINLLRMPLDMLPPAVANCIQGSLSLKRLGKFLGSSNIDVTCVCQDKEESSAIVIRGGQFSWGTTEEEEPWKLNDVGMTVGHGNLVAVVGTVGAGKSSLLSALLGEMQKEKGHVIVNGMVAYVSQQAWLQNATLRDNITWGGAFDENKYLKVIDACALQPDLDMLPGGDMTEIGEKGLNLSGGQKQRISLARAAYSDAEILLLDDPLSAVDSHVGKHIFQNLIGPNGLLKDKTRVLVTHAVWVLPQMDEICVIHNGSLVERGTYSQLLSQEGNFSQFLLQHINNLSEDGEKDQDDLDEVLGQLEETQCEQAFLRRLSCQDERNKDERKGSTRKRHYKSSSGSNLHQSDCDSEFSASTKNLRKSSLVLDEKSTGEVKEDGQTLVHEEKAETGKVKWNVYYVYCMAMGVSHTLLPFICFGIAQTCQAGGNVWLTRFSRPSDTTSNTTYEVEEEFDRTGFLLGYGGFGIGQSLFFYFGSLATMTGAMLAGRSLHERLLENILHLPMRFFDTNPSGRVMNRLSKEIDALDSILPLLLVNGISYLSTVLTTFIVIIAATPVMIVVISIILVVYYLVQNVYIMTARQIKRLESIAKSPIFSYLSETLQGVSTIRAFRMQNSFIAEGHKKIDNATKASVTNLATNRWLHVRLESLGNVITFSAAIFAVAGKGSIDPGIVGLSITYALSVSLMLSMLIRVTAEIEANIVSVERIQEYIEEEQEAPWSIRGKEPSKSWPENGCITFSGYQTRYRPGLELVLKGITCVIKSGEKVGIVGRTGAGKSSLTLGLFRIIEAAGGSIDIDGVNISKIGLHDLRGHLTIIPQDPVLFSGTMRVNVDPFDTYSDSEVWQALENAHLKDYVKAQASGLQTTIDEGGSNLSVGQKQLVCLARALLRKSKILVLDEATAAVDLDTDDLIQATIRKEFADCTILTIAHRLNNIMDSDSVIVLDKGKIEEFSSPSGLLADENSVFYGMARDAGLI